LAMQDDDNPRDEVQRSAPSSRPSQQDDGNWGRYLGIGLEIAVGVAVGYFVGSWLDRRNGWHGTGTLVGVMIGLAAGMYLLIKDAVRINKD